MFDLVDIRNSIGTPLSANTGAFGAQIRLTSWPRLPQCYLYPLYSRSQWSKSRYTEYIIYQLRILIALDVCTHRHTMGLQPDVFNATHRKTSWQQQPQLSPVSQTPSQRPFHQHDISCIAAMLQAPHGSGPTVKSLI